MTLTLRCSSSSAASVPRFFFAAPAPRLRTHAARHLLLSAPTERENQAPPQR